MYALDGTGRDTYIKANNGGFTNFDSNDNYLGFQKAFAKSLRGYTHPSVASTSPDPVKRVKYEYRSNNFLTNAQEFINRMESRVERTRSIERSNSRDRFTSPGKNSEYTLRMARLNNTFKSRAQSNALKTVDVTRR